ncbi:MAG: hypothetical protein GXX96_14555 [Planctomycetaceae bacterium]|nr:hypothetical protein [Planctomycetaceae bacterium]
MVPILTGCGEAPPTPGSGGPSAKVAGGGFDSPQAAFDAEKKAQLDGDWGALFDVYTPESRDQLAGMTAFGAVMVASNIGKEEEVKTVFLKHGIDEAKMPKKSSAADIAGVQAAMKEMEGQLAELVSTIKDKRAFFIEMAALVNDSASADTRVKEHVEAARKAQGAATLNNLQISGNTAVGIRQFTVNGQQVQSPVSFEEIDGSWYLHQSNME